MYKENDQMTNKNKVKKDFLSNYSGKTRKLQNFMEIHEQEL